MLTPAQIEARKRGVFASESAVLLGLSQWSTPYKLAAQKLGKVPPPADCFRFRAGHAMESLLLYEAQEMIGREVHVDGETRWAKRHVDLGAHLDGYVDDGDGILIPVEVKTVEWRRKPTEIDLRAIDPEGLGVDARGFEVLFDTDSSKHEWGEPGTDEIPDQYLVQVAHQMCVTDAPYAYVIAAFGYSDAQLYVVQRNPEIEDAIVDAAEWFLGYLRKGECPPPTTAQDVTAVFPRPKLGTYREAEQADVEVLRRYVIASEIESAAKKAKEAARDLLFTAIGDAEGLTIGGKKAFTAKMQDRAGYTVEPTSFRVGRALKPAKELAMEVARG